MGGALRWNQPAAWFFDMKAASASVEQAFLLNTFRGLSIPTGICEAIKVLYTRPLLCHDGGNVVGSFEVTAGIRQGCPLSPLLYVLATELFNQQLDQVGPRRGRGSYADDLALVVEGGPPVWREVRQLFLELAATSGLCFNLRKSVIIPLWGVTKRQGAMGRGLPGVGGYGGASHRHLPWF